MTAVRQTRPSRVTTTSAAPFQTVSTNTANRAVRGIDTTSSYVWAVSSTELFQSADAGVTWSTDKGFPSGTTAGASMGRMVRFGNYVYLIAKDTADSLWKVYRAATASGNTAFSWSTSLLTLAASSDQSHLSSMETDGTYLYVSEYGSPSGGPSAYRSANGTDWTTIFGPAGSAFTHIHHLAPDPYNTGHLWMTLGDSKANDIQRSIDSGDTWTVVNASTAWQGVMVSFTADWVWIANDNSKGTVMVCDRATETLRFASTNWHGNEAVPGGDLNDLFYKNAFIGAVHSSSGVYYCVANDSSAGGTTAGLFYLPHVGGRFELLEKLTSGVGNGWMGFLGSNMFFSDRRRPILTLETL